MARKTNFNSESQFQRWIKEGRGQGKGDLYKPWLTVRDVPSSGRSHRVFGFKSKRTHHFFSDLELAAFFIFEWHPQTQDIREQFPLERNATLEIALAAGIKHPAVFGVNQYMSTDFLINTSDEKIPKFAVQVKRSEELGKPRTIEKLEIERRYWAQIKIPWFVVTERDLPHTVVQNIEWLYPAQESDIPHANLMSQFYFYLDFLKGKSGDTLINISKSIDIAYRQPPGEALKTLRQLLANRYFLFDIRVDFKQLLGANLTPSPSIDQLEVSNASNK
jgi:TnsA endonuclease C terminal./TnsA endonuclease N terminal.